MGGALRLPLRAVALGAVSATIAACNLITGAADPPASARPSGARA